MIDSLELINILKNKNYDFKIHKHQPLYTVEDSLNKRGDIKGVHTKNLFLKNKKNSFFLISCEEHEIINLKIVSKLLGIGNVSFAKEIYLNKFLGIKPGSVSPFALINDKNGLVSFYLEETLYKSKYVNFHPLVNNLTITIETSKFIEFMIENNKKIHIFSSSKGLL